MASETKFTPGPWVVGPIDDTMVTHVAADGQRYQIARAIGDYDDDAVWPTVEANARLIAGAPKLYDSLRELDRCATEVSRRGAVTGPQWSALTGALVVARAALAKVQP